MSRVDPPSQGVTSVLIDRKGKEKERKKLQKKIVRKTIMAFQVSLFLNPNTSFVSFFSLNYC